MYNVATDTELKLIKKLQRERAILYIEEEQYCFTNNTLDILLL